MLDMFISLKLNNKPAYAQKTQTPTPQAQAKIKFGAGRFLANDSFKHDSYSPLLTQLSACQTEPVKISTDDGTKTFVKFIDSKFGTNPAFWASFITLLSDYLLRMILIL